MKERRIARGKPGQNMADSADAARRREEALRPCPLLGYDWDALGMHLAAREAYPQAEAMLRRAIWLNPFEPRFKIHLAWCLCRTKQYAEARRWLGEIPAGYQEETVAEVRRQIEEGEHENRAGI